MQVLDEPARREVLFHLLLTNKEELVEDVKVKGSLSCNNHENGVYNPERQTTELQLMDFIRIDFALFRILCETVV